MVDVKRDRETAVCVNPMSASSQNPNQSELKMSMDGRQWGQQPSPSSQNTYPEARVDQDPSGLAVCESRVMEERQTFRETINGQHIDDSRAC